MTVEAHTPAPASHLTAEVLERLQPRAMAALARTREHTHALLVSGPAGSGANAAALWLARWRLCPNGSGEDGCSSCRRVDRGTHPDLLWVTPEGAELRIEQTHEIAARVAQRPFEADAQVIVIEHADTLSSTNAAAGNALLKVLEEPPGPVLFVLLAERPSRLLPTLRSRVIHEPMPALADAAMAGALAAAGIDDGTLAWLGLTVQGVVRIAQGDYLRALDVAAGGEAWARWQVATGAALRLAARQEGPVEAADALLHRADAVGTAAEEVARAELEAAAELLPPKEAKRFRTTKDSDGLEARVRRRGRRARVLELRAALDDLATLYRDLMAAHAGSLDTLHAAHHAAAIASLASSPAAARAVAALDAIEEIAPRLNNNVDESVALQSLMGELASLAEDRIRARRTLGAPARTPQGVDLALG